MEKDNKEIIYDGDYAHFKIDKVGVDNLKNYVKPLKLNHIVFEKTANLESVIKVLQLADLCVGGDAIKKAKKIKGIKISRY